MQYFKRLEGILMMAAAAADGFHQDEMDGLSALSLKTQHLGKIEAAFKPFLTLPGRQKSSKVLDF